MPPHVFINSVAYHTGEIVPLTKLPEFADKPGAAGRLAAVGVTKTSAFSGSFRDLVLPVLRQLIRPDEPSAGIDAAVLTSPTNIADSASQESLLSMLADFGLERVRFVHVSGNECADVLVAIEYASGLLASQGAGRVLVLTANDYRYFSSRYAESAIVAFGDGAAGCLLSGNPGPYRVLGFWYETDQRLSQHRPDPRDQVKAIACLSNRVVQRTLTLSAMRIEDCEAIVCANMNTHYSRFIAGLLDVPLERIFTCNVGRFGHISDSDYLINLASLCGDQTRTFRPGAKVLVIALGSRTVASLALETTW